MFRNISVSACNIDKVTPLNTFPVQTYLVEIQEEMLIPKLIVPLSSSTLEVIIQATNRFAKIATDEPSVIGFVVKHFMDGIDIERKINPNYQTMTNLQMNTISKFVPGSTTTDQQQLKKCHF